MVATDFAEGHKAQARARIEAALESSPDNAALRMLAGRTFSTLNDLPRAEAELRKAIQLDPSSLAAYSLLGKVYIAQRKLDDATREFDTVAQKDPRALGARTMAAMLADAQGRHDDARARYERILQADPHAAVAANNLAWIYASDGGNLDVALQLAQTAKAALPDSPEVNDTLGWVYCQKKLYTLAVPQLTAAVRRNPENPVYKYHLGVAYAGAGDTEHAKKALQDALALHANFPGADDAKKVLGSL